MDRIQQNDLIGLDPSDETAVKDFLKANGVSLTVGEYARVCDLLGRQPSMVELHIFNTMWSEHCSYKSSRDVLKNRLPVTGPNVVLGPGEDAGVIRFHEQDGVSWCLVMAHESHNHPSQVLPVEGAATGIGGIVRDVYCMGADVIGVMDPLRFGDPDGPNAARSRDIACGVVEGIAQYGNALGVPNLGGETYFDASYDDNCLVNVVAYGIVREDGLVRSRVPDEAKEADYVVILFGKPTDASGFGGAAFASERLSEEEAVERQGAVQVPDPFLKRVLAEGIKSMLAWADRENVPIGFKDLGAGGISCAVSEMAEAAGMGVTIDLDKVNVAFDDLLPEVISCSETQERFLLAVPRDRAQEVCDIFNKDYDMPNLYRGAGAYVIGDVTREPRFGIKCEGRFISDADVQAITTGIKYAREAKYTPRKLPTLDNDFANVSDALLQLLGSINISDKSELFSHYDQEVQARAVMRPGEGDAAVQMFLPNANVGLALGLGSHSRLGVADPYWGGAWSVIESARNVVCVGATPLAVTDCLNFGDPEDPAVFHEFDEACRGIGEACLGLQHIKEGIPVVSGNVSLYNQSETGAAIPPTPIVSCAGKLEDAARARGFGFTARRNPVFFLGTPHDNLAGSEFERVFGKRYGSSHDRVPTCDFAVETAIQKAVLHGIDERWVLSAHDVSLGGVLVTIAEMAINSPFNIGGTFDLRALAPGVEHEGDPAAWLFSEMSGIVVEVDKEHADDFRKCIKEHDVPAHEIGQTSAQEHLAFPWSDAPIPLTVLRQAYRGKVGEVIL